MPSTVHFSLKTFPSDTIFYNRKAFSDLCTLRVEPPNPYSDCSMYTVKATKKNAVRMADTQMKEVLTKIRFIPPAPLNSAGLFNWGEIPKDSAAYLSWTCTLGDPLTYNLFLLFTKLI